MKIIRRLRDQRGYTLVELLTSAGLTVALVGLFTYMIVIAARNEPEISDRTAQIQRGRVLVERVTREVRSGSAVVSPPTTSQLSFVTFVRHTPCGGSTPLAADQPAISCRVSYSCTGSPEATCTRVEANPNGTSPGPAEQLVNGLSSPAVFGYDSATDPGHVTVTLVFPQRGAGEEAVTLSDGAELRNQ